MNFEFYIFSKDMFEEYFMENAEAAYFEASELRMKTGNKTFRFELPTII